MLIDTSHPWLRPLWVRVLMTVLCFAWAVFEFANDAPGWALIFGAAGAICAYKFFWTFHRDNAPSEPSDD